ncbi:hypothetical protein KI387_038921 [Taxus chinensis]|uniref:Uncharacterized protein n=1 Tax=Taxus chinensis TaxID=29808 RepID=A0AA38CAT3_TAXCH|nr:hypothetical protein KI387_038921 [Taxus chinensis]
MSSSKAVVNPEGDEVSESESEDEEEKELEQLETEVKELGERVLELRRTMKSVFRDKIESVLLALRPTLPGDKPSSSVDGSKDTQGTETLLARGRDEQEVDQEMAVKIELLKSKIAANVAAMPATTERMKLCIEKIDRLDQYKVKAEYAFTKE